jgi:hypothetical protein
VQIPSPSFFPLEDAASGRVETHKNVSPPFLGREVFGKILLEEPIQNCNTRPRHADRDDVMIA